MSSSKRRIKRRRLALALIVVVVVGAIVTAWLANQGGKAPEILAPVEQADYDRFLYILHKKNPDGKRFNTLVQVKITPEGFERQEVRIQGKFPSDWKPACVVGGKVYSQVYGALQAVDLRTGGVETICAGLENVAVGMPLGNYYADGKFYAVVKLGGKPTMRVFDLRRRSYRDIGPFKIARGFSWTFAVSPDQQRVAYFVSQPAGPKKPMFPPAWLIKSMNFVLRRPAPAKQTFESYFQLHAMDIETGESEDLPAGATYARPITDLFLQASGPPFFWLDAKTIVCLSTKPQSGFSPNPWPSGPYWLRAIDVTTGELDDVAAIPGRSMSNTPLTREPAKATASVKTDDGWFTLDRVGRKLAEGRVSGECYRLRRDKEKRWVLSCDGRPIARSAEEFPLYFSPDAKRVLWHNSRWKKVQTFVDGKWVTTPTPDRRSDVLQYHAVGEAQARVVDQGSFGWDSFLWYTDEDLESAPTVGELPEGWLAFGVEPKSSNIETGRNSE
ncbi:hypothetical protein ACFL34_00745 [Candidatus Sumerlaeota bacterium]